MKRSSVNGAINGLQNPLDVMIGYQLRRASALMMSDLTNALEDLQLRPTEGSILLLIGANPGITQSDIGRTLGITRANMAPIAAMLTTRGLVDRTRPDRRSQGLQLSTLGVETADEIRKRINTHENRILKAFGLPERADLAVQIKRIWHG